MKTKKALKILSALAQETRLAIVRLLVQESEEGLSAGMIAEILQVPPATLSFHLSLLTDAGVLKSKKDGRNITYSVKHKSLKKLNKHLVENSHKKRPKKEELEVEQI
jgi:DNA-binding transcriptional ArsR family regulator